MSFGVRILATVPRLVLLLLTAPGGAQNAFEPADDWGIDFVHQHGGTGAFYMTETMGSGAAVFDFDGDGDRDVLLLSSGPTPEFEGAPAPSQLFRNDAGRFVPWRGTPSIEGYPMGAAVGDVNGDGVLDLVVTTFGPDQLFLGTAEGTFVPTLLPTEPSWGTSAAFDDVDGDGDLDLYITRYVDFDYDNNKLCGIKERGLRSYCHPNVYGGLDDVFFTNDGQGNFSDRTKEAGFGSASGNGLGVIFSDLDGDGLRDLYVANDMTANYQFMNSPAGSFEELALLFGTALSNDGAPEAGMGVAAGDLDGDGRMDLITTHLDQQTNAVYGNTGTGVFVDRRFVSKLAEPSLPKVGFGVSIEDFDLDGDNDVFVANGHIIHNVEDYERGTTFKQPNQLFLNGGDGVFTESGTSGLDVVESSRGSATGDLDGDGDLDLVINNSNARAEVYRNLATGHWIALEPRWRSRVDVGARVTLRGGAGAAARTQVSEVRSGTSYLSHSDSVATFGLGEDPGEPVVELTWSDGRKQTFRGLPADRRIVVRRSPARGSAP